MAVSKASIVKLITTLGSYGGSSARSLLSGEGSLSDTDVTNLSNNIGQILSADEVFNAASIAKLAGDRSDLHTNAEALVYAATKNPRTEVFIGAGGLAKLVAWARSEAVLTVLTQETVNTVAATDTPANVFAGAPGIAKLDAWALANGYTK